MTLRSTLALLVMLAMLAFSGPAEACALACGSHSGAAKHGCCEQFHGPMPAAAMAGAHSGHNSGGSNAMAGSPSAMGVVAGLAGSCPSSQCAEHLSAHVAAEAVPASYAQQPGVGQAPELVELPEHKAWNPPQPKPLKIKTAVPLLQANLRV